MIEVTRAVARQFMEFMETGNSEGMKSLLAPDMRWWDVMRGYLPDAEYSAASQEFRKLFKSPIKITIHGMVVEGDKAAVELESYVVLIDDIVYNNHYHMLLKIRDDKIIEIKEYLDTQHVVDTFTKVSQASRKDDVLTLKT